MRSMIDTPALLVDKQKLYRNLQEMAQRAQQHGIKLRPHTKTHKSVFLAKKQLEFGASGITVAKLGEAEVMVAGGITDILIAYPIIGEKKLLRLKALLDRAKITVSLDSIEAAKGLSDLGLAHGKPISVYLEVDTGLGRCGLVPGEELIRLAKQIAKLPGVQITGIMTHSGQAYRAKEAEEIRSIVRQESEIMKRVKEDLERNQIPIQEVSVGSTPTCTFLEESFGITEIRPGTYIFNDYREQTLGVVEEEQCALSILTTVVSRPQKNRLIIDAGSKTLTSDPNILQNGYGKVKGTPYVVNWCSEEHGVIYVPEDCPIQVGDTLEVIPNHVCPTVNLADEIYLVENDEIVEVIPIDGRGKNR